MIGLLLAVALQSDRVRDLVRQLDADDADRRDAAQVELLKLGREIAPQLKTYVDGASAEVGARLHAILDRFDLDERIEKVLPPVRTVTLERATRTAREWLDLIREQTGYRVPVYGVDLGARLDLGWDGAPALQTLDDLCAALEGASLHVPGNRDEMWRLFYEEEGPDELKIEAGADAPAAFAYWGQFGATVNDVAITETRKMSGTTEEASISVGVRMQPGTAPLQQSGWIVDVAEDDRGKSLKLADGREEADPELGEDREAVWFSDDEWSWLYVSSTIEIDSPAPEAKRIARLVLRRRFTFPLGRETRTFKMADFEVGTSVRFGDTIVTVQKAAQEEQQFKAEFTTQGSFTGTPDFTLLDADGRPIRTSGHGSSGSGSKVSKHWSVNGEVDTMSISAVVGVLTIEATFEFRDVPLPERP